MSKDSDEPRKDRDEGFRTVSDRIRELLPSDDLPEVSLDRAARAVRAAASHVRREPQSRPDAPTGPRTGADQGPGDPAERPPSSHTVAIERLGQRGPSHTRYRVGKTVARGGMGAILSARDEDLRREIAMKVVLGPKSSASRSGDAVGARVDHLDPKILARFVEEAQITGQLDHPGIVPVHELGLDDDGRIYFTMQLVRGRDLESVFERVGDEGSGWTLTRALDALLKACDAVAYAHSKGVIHRDLKPANVMVGDFGEVYVMDWGLARVAGHPDRHELRVDDTGKVVTTARHDAADPADALRTLDGELIGTPAYMSPEQASGRIDDIDERSDVYAVGAMIYRLLAGTPPYVPLGSRRSAAQILASLHVGPPTPLHRAAPRVPAELAAICEKAMARDARQRYRDMRELAEDLRAYLERRVVRAYATGPIAETRSWVRRNRALAGSFAALLVALVAGLATSWTLKASSDRNALAAERNARAAETSAREAERNAHEAEVNAREAERNAREAEEARLVTAEVNRFLNEDLLGAVTPGEQGIDVSMREVLEVAAVQLDGSFDDRPLVEASLRRTIGQTFHELGEFERALPFLERAWTLHRDQLGEDASETLETLALYGLATADSGSGREGLARIEDAEARLVRHLGEEHPTTLSTRSKRAFVLKNLGDYEEAREAFEEVLELQQRVLGEDSPEALIATKGLGTTLYLLGDHEAAETRLRDALDRQRRTVGTRDPGTIRTLNDLGIVLTETMKLDEAEAVYEETRRLIVDIFGEDHPGFATATQNLGALRRKQGDVAGAEVYFREAVERLRASLREDHPRLLSAMSNLAVATTELGRLDEAYALRTDLLARQRRELGKDHTSTIRSLGNLGILELRRGNLDEAERIIGEATEQMAEALGEDHPSTILNLENLGNVYYRQGRREEAEDVVRRVLEARRRAFGNDHPLVARTLQNLGSVRQAAGKHDEAVECFREARSLYLNGLGPVHPSVAQVTDQLARALVKSGKAGEAIEVYESALVDLRAAGAKGSGPLVTLLSQLTGLLQRTERFEKAEPSALEWHAAALEAFGPDDRRTRSARKAVAEVYEALGQDDEAARWR